MRRLREAYYIGIWDSLPLLRDPMMLFILSLISLLPVFFLSVFMGPVAALPALVGAMVLSLAFTGISLASSVYFNKHWFRFQDILVASPVSPLSYAFGLSISTLILSLPTLVLAIAVLMYAHPVGPLELGAVLAVSVLMWLSLVFLGFALGVSTKNTRRANSVPQILGFLLGFMPPVYYSLDMLPAVAQPLAMLIPTTHAAQLAKHYFGLITIPDVEIVVGWVYLLLFLLLMAVVSAKKARWVDP